jgi:hypothetical protein
MSKLMMSKLSLHQAERVLQAVHVERSNGRAATTAEIARTLGADNQAGVQKALDALVASGHLACDQACDLVFQDCDWPAAPLGAYTLTQWGEAMLVALAERMMAEVVELALQAYEQTGNVRDAVLEAAAQARRLSGMLVPAGT